MALAMAVAMAMALAMAMAMALALALALAMARLLIATKEDSMSNVIKGNFPKKPKIERVESIELTNDDILDWGIALIDDGVSHSRSAVKNGADVDRDHIDDLVKLKMRLESLIEEVLND